MQKYILGIDLGTSHSALAFSKAEDEAELQILEIPQLSAPKQLSKNRLLPSVLYRPLSNEGVESDLVLGLWARERAAEVPSRCVVSAKSWLSHSGIDRRSACLPWGFNDEVSYSPIEVLARILSHMRQAFLDQYPKAQETQVVITVPASFDAVARQLSSEAAQQAGFTDFTLLEEPQAAFYSWLAHTQDWREQVSAGDLILVCDLGGGTCDFSLIAISELEGKLELERVSVGAHLLLGGDNMDLALALKLRAELEKTKKLDRKQFAALLRGVCKAKEAMFNDPELDEFSIPLPSSGAKLVAKTRSVKLKRKDLESIILEGFFPLCSPDEVVNTHSSGFQEMGLNYEHDPAVSRHLAAFLRQSYKNLSAHSHGKALLEKVPAHPAGILLPSGVLFNGGVFQAKVLKQRLLDLLENWRGEAVRELPSEDLDLAVASGAAVFAKQKFLGKGIRMAAGTAYSYYLGLESGGLAVPGYVPPIQGFCLVPQGTEEGVELEIPPKTFGLRTGKTVRFRFFSSAARGDDRAGDLVADAASELEELAPLEVTLSGDAELLPVQLAARVTELGVLELSMHHIDTGQKWRLEFEVRPN